MTIWQRIAREPALVTSAIRALLYSAVLFGLPLTVEQSAGVILAVEAVLALITRAVVTPSAEVIVTQRPDQETPVASNGAPVHVYPILGKA